MRLDRPRPPRCLGHHDRLGAHLDRERLCDRQHRRRRGHNAPALAQTHEVDAGAGEIHGRMDRERNSARRDSRRQHPDPEPRCGVRNELPCLPSAGRSQPGYERRELRLRHGQDDQLAAFDQIGDREYRNARQERVGTIAARRRERRDPDDRVAGAAERGTEHRADAARADDPDAEATVTMAASVNVAHELA